MRIQTALFILAILTLTACQRNTPEQPASDAATPVSGLMPEAALPTPTSGSLYLPLAAGGGSTTPTPTVTARPTEALETPPTALPAFPPYTGSPLQRNDIGVQIHLHREKLDTVFGHLRELGVGWVKVQVSWKLYQPYADRYSDERFRELDGLVDKAADHNIKVMLSAGKAPEWSRPTTELDGPPSDYALYRAFMAHLAGRYQGRVHAYELWNEPNLQREWNGSPLSAADFVSLMRAGAEGVRGVDEAAVLIAAAPATTGINDGIAAIDDRIYFQQMLDAGAADVVDVFGVHPYGWANPPDSSAATPDPAANSHNNHPSFFFWNTLHDYDRMLKERSIGAQLWVTEFGWGSFDGFDAQPPQGAEFMAAVSEWQQASYTLRAFELANEWEWVGPMMLWNLNFAPLLGTEFTESGYSVLRPTGSRRPVYLSLAAAPKS